MATSPWSAHDLDTLSELINDGENLDALVAFLNRCLDESDDLPPEIEKLSSSQRETLARLSVTNMLARFWTQRLSIETATARRGNLLTWNLIARATGYSSGESAYDHFRRIVRTPRLRDRSTVRTTLPLEKSETPT